MSKRKGDAWRDYGFGKNDPQQDKPLVCPVCKHPGHTKNRGGWCYKSGCFCSPEMKHGG